MFISPAYAQAAGGGDAGLGAFLPLILIFAVFYFLLIRPQQKKAKAHREMLAAVRRGDPGQRHHVGDVRRILRRGDLCYRDGLLLFHHSCDRVADQVPARDEQRR